MKISVEDSRTGKLIKLDVKVHSKDKPKITQILNRVVSQMSGLTANEVNELNKISRLSLK